MNGMYQGPDVITTARPPLLGGDAAAAEVAARWGCEEISDACALTVASWWQSPGRVGRAFAQLASTGSVPLEALADDISATFAELRSQHHATDLGSADRRSSRCVSREIVQVSGFRVGRNSDIA